VAPAKRVSPSAPQILPPFGADHAIFRLVGVGRGGGQRPGARDKHALLER
jgi:hypothetical protein